MRAHVLFVVLAAWWSLAASPAEAHSFPKKAPALKSFLVQNYPACLSPDGTTGNFEAACVGASEVDPSCVFSSKGIGTFSATVKSKTKIAIAATVSGLDPQCEGKTLTAALQVRTTSDSCPDDHCTSVDKEILAGSCVVAKGRCAVKATVDPGFEAGSGAEMTVLRCGMNNGNLATFVCGIMIK